MQFKQGCIISNEKMKRSLSNTGILGHNHGLNMPPPPSETDIFLPPAVC
jgi:hypothetical protein